MGNVNGKEVLSVMSADEAYRENEVSNIEA
jgi:hypothetical protein